jgi:hypothetical protein
MERFIFPGKIDENQVWPLKKNFLIVCKFMDDTPFSFTLSIEPIYEAHKNEISLFPYQFCL